MHKIKSWTWGFWAYQAEMCSIKTPWGSTGPGRASSPTSVCPSPLVRSKNDGLPPAICPALHPRLTDWTVRNTGMGCPQPGDLAGSSCWLVELVDDVRLGIWLYRGRWTLMVFIRCETKLLTPRAFMSFVFNYFIFLNWFDMPNPSHSLTGFCFYELVFCCVPGINRKQNRGG